MAVDKSLSNMIDAPDLMLAISAALFNSPPELTSECKVHADALKGIISMNLHQGLLAKACIHADGDGDNELQH